MDWYTPAPRARHCSILTALLALALIGQSKAQNLVQNGGFENGVSGWEKHVAPIADTFRVAAQSSVVLNGSSALVIFGTDQTISWAQQAVSVPYVDTDITFYVYPIDPYSGFFNLSDRISPSNVFLNFRVNFKDGDVEFISEAGNTVSASGVIASSSWNKITVRVEGGQTQRYLVNDMEVGSITTSAGFPLADELQLGDGNGQTWFGTMYFDDVSIVENPPEPGACQLPADPVLAIDDSVFTDWIAQVSLNSAGPNGVWSLDASTQDTAVGNPTPSRNLTYSYSGPANRNAATEVMDWWAMRIIPPAEGIQTMQVDFDVAGDGRFVGPIILQGSTYYRGPTFIQEPDSPWLAYSSGCLRMSDFTKRTGPGAGSPDSTQPFVVGYSVMSFTDEVSDQREHWIDNFRFFTDAAVTFGAPPPVPNLIPIAVNDLIVLEQVDATRWTGSTEALANDFDPDGDPLEITAVGESESGTPGWNGGVVDFLHDAAVDPAFATTSFTYDIFDGESSAQGLVTVFLEDCGAEAAANAKAASASRSIDLDLIRRFRDEVMRMTEDGSRIVDLYYGSAAEVVKILVLDRPDLRERAFGMLELLEPSLFDIVNGDGNLPMTQAQMDTLGAFFNDLAAAGSIDLRELIEDESARVGDLDGYVGTPVSEVLDVVLGGEVGTNTEDEVPTERLPLKIEQSFPNPFSRTTEINLTIDAKGPVSLVVFDIQGRRVKTILRGASRTGTVRVEWDGRDDTGRDVPSGVYLLRLVAGTVSTTGKLVVSR